MYTGFIELVVKFTNNLDMGDVLFIVLYIVEHCFWGVIEACIKEVNEQ